MDAGGQAGRSYDMSEVHEAMQMAAIGTYGAALVLTRVNNPTTTNDSCAPKLVPESEVQPPLPAGEHADATKEVVLRSSSDTNEQQEEQREWQRGVEERLRRFQALRDSVEAAVAAAARAGAAAYGGPGVIMAASGNSSGGGNQDAKAAAAENLLALPMHEVTPVAQLPVGLGTSQSPVETQADLSLSSTGLTDPQQVALPVAAEPMYTQAPMEVPGTRQRLVAPEAQSPRRTVSDDCSTLAMYASWLACEHDVAVELHDHEGPGGAPLGAALLVEVAEEEVVSGPVQLRDDGSAVTARHADAEEVRRGPWDEINREVWGMQRRSLALRLAVFN